jgi:TetR/AcrR family transcriptional regulator, cholesterol catabolism regulator
MDALTKILTAAIGLFRQYGFKTITMDDIARRSGISKKTLYQHFANKQEVISETVGWYKNQLLEQCEQVVKDASNAIEAMVRLTDLLDQTMRQTNPVSLMELQRYYPDGFQRFRETILNQDVAMIRNNIQQGIEEGLYRPEVDADLMARFHIETSLSMCQSPILMGERYDLQHVHYELAEHFMYGIMTAKGIKLYTKYKETYLKQAAKL